jgi:DNA-binding response OmpR family regulator
LWRELFLGADLSKILILEDDAELRSEIAECLEDEGFLIRQCGTVADFWREHRQFAPDLALIDLNLPDGRGSTVVRELWLMSEIGILVLSGQQGEADRIIALEFGADDFVVKPCGPRELTARVNAILRRTLPGNDRAVQSDAPQSAEFAGFVLDLAAMELRGPDGDVQTLTTTEFQLLKLFIERPQRVLSRGQLLDLLRGEDWAGYDRTIDGLVSRLRKKLAPPEGETPFLKTVHGTGYVFTQPVSRG